MIDQTPPAWEWLPKQDQLVRAIMSNRYRQLLFGGAIGGGKTYGCIMLVMLFCKIWPGSRWAITRKDLPSLRKTAIPSFLRLKAYMPGFFGEIHKDEWTVKAANGSEIIFWPASEREDKDLDRWKGLEVNGFLFEEANEMSHAAYMKAIQRSGRWHIPGLKSQPPPLWLGTCNPNRTWVKTVFYDPWKRGALAAPFFYLPALLHENNKQHPEYMANLKANMLPREWERDVMGNWDLADEPNQLIASEWVELAFKRGRDNPNRVGFLRLGVDVARSGRDKTSLAEVQGRHLDYLKSYAKTPADMVVDLVTERIERPDGVKGHNVRLDSIGVGGGPVDFLRKAGHLVQEFIAGATAPTLTKDGKKRFFNLKAEAWHNMAELLRKGEASFDPSLAHISKIMEDLTAPTYEVDSDRIFSVESKEDIFKRLGRSTDDGDAIVMAYAEMKLNALDKWKNAQ